MNNKQKVIELIKRLLASGSVREVLGSFHEQFLAATPEERAALQEGAREMSEEELERARAEVAREAGAEGAEAADLVLQALRGSRGGGEGQERRARRDKIRPAHEAPPCIQDLLCYLSPPPQPHHTETA